MKSSSLILDNDSVNKKLDRITQQIIEDNYNEKELIIIGISEKGFLLAKKIVSLLQQLQTSINIDLIELIIDKSNPKTNLVELKPDKSFQHKKVILIDDVLNSGKTLMHAAAHVLEQNISKMKTFRALKYE